MITQAIKSRIPLTIPKFKPTKIKEFVSLYYEPVVTLSIIPNCNPEVNNDHMKRNGRRNYGSFNRDFDWEDDIYNQEQTSKMLLNTINGIFSKFYLPEKMRVYKDGIKIKMSDTVSYKVAITNGQMKFYLTIPKRWSDSFKSAIKRDWGNVDITEVEEKFIDFNPTRTKAMEVHLRHHYALSLKYEKKPTDELYSSLASLASTLGEKDKVLIDYNITPVNEMWKGKAKGKLKKFKEGKIPSREDTLTISGIVVRVFDMFNVVFDEFVDMIENIMGATEQKEEKKEQLFDLKYSDQKLNADSQGYKVQIRVLGESDDDRKIKHAFRNIESAFELLNGDNKFVVTNINTKRGIKAVIKAVENNRPMLGKTPDILFQKEMSNIVTLPSKQTIKEYSDAIPHDNFTRLEIDEDFFNDEEGGIPFATTLEKKPKTVYFGGYKRNWWTDKGRYVKDKTKLDDRCTPTCVISKQGGGKTSMSENQALYTFGVHLPENEWKEKSKSVVVFDVADGEMIRNIYNYVPDRLKHRVIILNHGNFNHPISVNNADLDEYNREFMNDEDYSYTLAEMEAKLILEILESDKSIAIDRWFTSALQSVHTINPDWGYIEAMKTLLDDEFRALEIIPKLENNKRLKLEMETYHSLSANGKAGQIIQTIENRFSQLERDQKLWRSIAQKPLRDENGKVKLNFRKLMDGDEDGAYMILIHIPKSGVSSLYRRFIFAQYFTKIWSVALSREAGFGGREYRCETLVIIDEIHQILNIPLVAKLFVDLFKETRKYSIRPWLTLHGFSSFSTAGKNASAIKQSILDNGCNIVLLKGGADSYDQLKEFLSPFTIADYNNLMNMPFTGIFSIHYKSKMHVFQGKLIKHIQKNKDFKKYSDFDSDFLMSFKSEYGRNKNEVSEDILERAYSLIGKGYESDFELSDEDE